jgi:hypothetical protein
VSLPQLEATRAVNDHMVKLAENNEVPAPVKGGFRRMSAEMLRGQAVQAYDHYETLTTDKKSVNTQAEAPAAANPASAPAAEHSGNGHADQAVNGHAEHSHNGHSANGHRLPVVEAGRPTLAGSPSQP